jgi:NAD(P)-dependent dehydrogenase (short-subunit alcohol dehydrogenase family)
MRFESRAVIVTGSSRGIGRAIALAFGEEGADLVLADVALGESVEEEARKLAAVQRRS